MSFLDVPGITPAGLDQAAAALAQDPDSEFRAAQNATYGRSSTAALTDESKSRSMAPNFYRINQNVLTQAASGLNSLYWPWPIRVSDKIPGALADIYVYFSTDHDNGAGGIAMAYTNDPATALTPHGVVFTDTTGGAQTETPAVMWAESDNLVSIGSALAVDAATDTVTKTAHGLKNGRSVYVGAVAGGAAGITPGIYYVVNATANTFQLSRTGGRTGTVWGGGAPVNITTSGTIDLFYQGVFFKFYQQDYNAVNGTQRTRLATSPDGLTWTVVGTVINGKGTQDAHTGYMVPFRIGSKWAAYHLLSGGNYPTMGMSWSDDGRTWFTDPVNLGYELDFTGSNGLYVNWHKVVPIQFRGKLWALIGITDYTSGGAIGVVKFVTAPLLPSLRKFDGRPMPMNTQDVIGTETVPWSIPIGFISHKGKIYGYYVSESATGSIGVMMGDE